MTVDDEFGLTVDPCEHPSMDGTTVEGVLLCLSCGELVREIDNGDGTTSYRLA